MPTQLTFPFCAPDRTRTCTSEILDPKSSASTNSATSASSVLFRFASAKVGKKVESSKFFTFHSSLSSQKGSCLLDVGVFFLCDVCPRHGEEDVRIDTKLGMVHLGVIEDNGTVADLPAVGQFAVERHA